jgi:hypothetical protein
MLDTGEIDKHIDGLFGADTLDMDAIVSIGGI